jgi:hypothetical protein
MVSATPSGVDVVTRNPWGRHPLWNARAQLFFFFGTFFPFFRAFDNPMAIACFLLLTRPPFPFGPLFAVPFLYRRISLFTSLPELFEYFRFLAFLAMTVPQIACEKIICDKIVGSLSSFWAQHWRIKIDRGRFTGASAWQSA